VWHNDDALLCNLIIAAVPANFLTAKRNPVTGFGNVTCLALLTHLHNVYGRLTEQELEQNVQLIRTQWNPPTAIESIFVQIEDGVPSQSKGRMVPPNPIFSAGPMIPSLIQGDLKSLAVNK
jgi:hypothetical protein